MVAGAKVISKTIQVETKGHSDVIDVTSDVEKVLERAGLVDGIVSLFVVGSTAGITTIEYEPGLVHDIKVALDKVAPENGHYEHHERWGDDNGHSHIRASLMGPSLTIPFSNKKLLVGTWQQIVLIDFDTRPRTREVIAQIIGS